MSIVLLVASEQGAVPASSQSDDTAPQAGQHAGQINPATGTIAGQVRAHVKDVDRPVPGALVWVSAGLEATSYPRPSQPLVIDQINMKFAPHVSAAVVGQTVQIRNSDNTYHNVKMISKHNGRFNHTMVAGSVALVKRFTTPEIGTMSLRCDVHPLMLAYLHVLEHPFFAVSNNDGQFAIRGLPPGTYELGIWHKAKRLIAEPDRVTVNVAAGQKSEVSFTLQRRGQTQRPQADGPEIADSLDDQFHLEPIVGEPVGTIAQMQFGPDGRLYVATTNEGIYRFDYSTRARLRGRRQISQMTAIGIAFDRDPVLGTVIYLTPYDERGILRRIGDGNGDGAWGQEGELNQDLVTGIPVTGHRMNQIQIRDHRLCVGIGTRSDLGTAESAYTGTITWIQDLRLLTDTVTANLAGFDIQDFETDPAPYLSTALDKLVIHSTGARNPFGLAYDGDGHLWMTNNQNDEPPIRQDQLFKTFPKADYGLASRNPITNWREHPDVRAAGYFRTDHRARSLTEDRPDETYEPDDPTPGGHPPGGLGPHSSANGLDFYRGHGLPLRWHKNAFIARLSPRRYGVAKEKYADLVAVDLRSGQVIQIADDFDMPLAVLMDGSGNVLVGEGSKTGRIWRLSPKRPVQQPHPFAWDSDAGGHWSDRLKWAADIDGDGRIDAGMADTERIVPNAWGTARYQVTIQRSSADPVIGVDQDAHIEQLTLADGLRIEAGRRVNLTGPLEALPGSTLIFELGPEAVGQIVSSASVSLHGHVVVTLTGGHVPEPGDQFDLVVADSIDHDQADFDLEGVRFKAAVVPAQASRVALRLTVQPPASAWPVPWLIAAVGLIIALAAIGIMRRAANPPGASR